MQIVYHENQGISTGEGVQILLAQKVHLLRKETEMPVVNESNLVEVAKYDVFVKTHPFAIATQDPAWFQVKADWKHERVYLSNEAGDIIAAMSLVIKEVIGGHSLAYAPRGPVCDIYDVDLVMRLIAEAEPALSKHKVFVLRLDPEVVYDEALDEKYRKQGFVIRNRQFGEKNDLIQPRYNMVLHLKGKDWDSLNMEFSSKTRYNIRLATKKGVKVRWSRSDEDLRTFFNLYHVTCLRDKIGERPYAYFRRMRDAFEDNQLRIYIAEYQGESLSAAIAINYGDKMWYLYGASSNERRNLMPNYAMQAAMIEWALEEGCRLYDFGGVFHLTKENGLYKFKEGFCRTQGVTEFIGEYDLVRSGFWYRMFTVVAPAARKMLKLIKR